MNNSLVPLLNFEAIKTGNIRRASIKSAPINLIASATVRAINTTIKE